MSVDAAMVSARSLLVRLQRIAEDEDPKACDLLLFGKTEAREIGALLRLLLPEAAADFPGLRNLKRRVSRARKFPENTTPADRHLHNIALTLAEGGTYSLLTEEPRHCAESMLHALEGLYKARAELRKLGRCPKARKA